MKKIGFIGVGIMGKSMVRNLMKDGFEVTIYTRTKAKVLDVLEEGAIWSESVADCSKGKDAVITIVGYPHDVEEVYYGENGIIETADQGTYLIDMTTNSPKLAQDIYEKAKTKGLSAIDAPVTGGDTGAKNGTLTILAGGDKEAYEACYPLFEAMGENITYEGKAGNGQHTKMANQIAIAGTLAGVCEAFAYAQKCGLDLQTCFDSISTGAAGSSQMSVYMPRILDGDFEPGFFIKHFIKDMEIAVGESEKAGADLEILNHVLEIYQKMAEQGKENLGTQAIYQYYTE